ncbi:MAG TPA: TfuA-related McrA-glycine thioamidation protein [Methanothrix sp.]|nr:TfuA-related McrA-glycine thioamidation protein [Methanothrix sp.]HPC89410.1 TfuA-related McrA-glycine thioamidation protein [Methanothrix sp.]HQE87593.1 TfuA-related McrA-glycine thioamidation protein [Methanothrix sp.]HQI68431.1 TfuA-related McrA-glycine thioamidation protein [Methanothrix sp.]HRS85063.1 TfuA-related McrA-glycine thioamidation protein [Methanothrix sp.]
MLLAAEIVVFLGPSLSLDKAREMLEADFRPPAKRGDIYRAAREGARVICLIDGVFFQDCSVAHKEVLYALEAGARVLGASSMGALRASELDAYGMEGVGMIYEAYRSGRLVSDDEVALTFDPFTFAPQSEPLVNIRFNLDLAWQNGVIDSAARERLLHCASSLYFPERSYERMLAAAKGLVEDEDLQAVSAFLEREKRDFKMEDAVCALQRVRQMAYEMQ